MTKQATQARIYCGTFAKYNNGSIAGQWLDLEDYTSKEDFLAACAELHKDEADPEFMFQDFEGFPKRFYSESSVPDELWDWLALDEDDRELLAVYLDHTGDEDATIDQARDAFQGRFRSAEDWAEDYAEQTGMLSSVPENLRFYFDMEKFAHDCEISGDVSFVDHEGEVWVFSNH